MQKINKILSLFLALFMLSPLSYAQAIIDKDVLSNLASHRRPAAFALDSAKPAQTSAIMVFLHSKQDMQAFLQKIQAIKGISWQDLGVMPGAMLQGVDNEKTLRKIASFPEVAQLSSYHPAKEELDIAIQSIKLAPSASEPTRSNWWDAGFTGQKGVLGLIDTGIDPTHPALADKKIVIRQEKGSQYDTCGWCDKKFIGADGRSKCLVKNVEIDEEDLKKKCINGVKEGHGTGVSCIYSSNDPVHKGIAYGVSTIVSGLSGEETADISGNMLTMSTIDWMLNRAEVQPNVINYSMGNGALACTNCPEWSGLAKVIDYIVNTKKILWVKSAGNSGYIAATDSYPFASSLTVPGDHYNALSVANMDNNMIVDGKTVKTPDRDKHIIRSTSSRGPTPFGRKKPDLTAPGHDTRTCAPSPDAYPILKELLPYTKAMDYQNGFRLMGGTSSAAPQVGAAALLLQDAGITSPMAIKALLINSADAWTDNNTPNSGHSQMMGSHWDRTYGWGYLNMDEAFKQRNAIHEAALSLENPVWEHQTRLAKGQKVTLVHERRVGYTKEGKEWALSHLSLEIINLANNKVISKDESAIDSVHQADNCQREAGEKTCNKDTQTINALVRVTLISKAIDGSTKEPFAVVVPEKEMAPRKDGKY